MVYLDSGIFLLFVIHVPPANIDNDVSTSLSRDEIAIEGYLEQLGGPTAFPLANDRMTSVNSSIVGWTTSGVFTRHWSRYWICMGHTFGYLVFRRL